MKDEKDWRPFPVQAEHGRPNESFPRTMIPWWVAEIAHEEYAKYHNQSLERIAERGGFGWMELVLLLGKEWQTRKLG